ncbi:phenylacetic acid degradation protein PaaN [Govanella unica]|uniref:Phenylacetic acid degradation protein PaaN n=1 Tax=Govanella unica TaxID=2975056 RepID=A0A9X3TXC7_9PROT|nr:phenylacetic acid degradation protein PaaN [Govania unica]MDA5193422.1 phenylacetic acid degradation protein PaaN [Govania unica]
MTNNFFERHKATLERAVEAAKTRGYWTPYNENAKSYPETAAPEGDAAFKARLNKKFELNQPGEEGWVGAERSPWGFDLGVQYPKTNVDQLIAAVEKTIPEWRKAGVEGRVGVCLEILDRLNKRSYEIAHAVSNTSGQGFMMAFQAGGPHAQDRGLEAVTYAYMEMARTPGQAYWEKPQGKFDPLKMDKTFHVTGRGIALVIGCGTFPTWNTYPGLFASLATGNPVIVKPHPRSILPAAISVEIARDVLREAGFDPNIVTLVADSADAPVTKDLALHPEVKVIDFTGSTQFGDWLEQNARQALVYTEKAGVNCVVIDSTDDFAGMIRNLTMTICLYSGQMCTTPQNFFVPKDGILVAGERKSFDEVAQALADAVAKMTGDADKAMHLLGGIQTPDTVARIDQAAGLAPVVLASQTLTPASAPDAVIRTPLIMKATSKQSDLWGHELFGPIYFLIATENTAESIAIVKNLVKTKGAITSGIYATDETIVDAMEDAMVEAGVALSVNLHGGVFVNQTAAFSDYHATGANPAANACLADAAFVANRFRIVQSRRHTAA